MENVLELLELASKTCPNKSAVVLGAENLNYKELLEKSKQIGAELCRLNLKNEPIAIWANQNPNTIAMLFGVLFSHNYYVMIDPTSPQNRLELMLKGIKVMLCSSKDKNVFNLVEGINCQLLFAETCTNTNCDAITKALLDFKSSDPLYMVYTSGSTGTPKGVIKSHKAMLSYVEAFTKVYPLNESDIVGNQTPFYFDAFSKDIYLAIKNKITLCIIEKELFSFPVKLIEFLNEQKITFISWVPSALTIVAALNTFKYILPAFLKYVFFVGEVMPIKHLNYWIGYLPKVKFVNLYGSSETAGISCYFECNEIMDTTKSLPIGKPLPNCEILLLTENKVASDFETGEICICSDILATEYYNDVEKTNKVFELNPITMQGRIYHTGDLAYYDDNKNLIFVGRKDFQIKHMGHRIELGEIEIALQNIKEVVLACCIYDHTKNKILAFFSTFNNEPKMAVELIEELKKYLPSYMIPNKFIQLNELPKNKNGKIDREQLKQLVIGA